MQTIHLNGSDLKGLKSLPNPEKTGGTSIQVVLPVDFQTNDWSVSPADHIIPQDHGFRIDATNLKGSVKTLIQVAGGSLISAGISWFTLERFSFDLMAGLSFARYYDPEQRKNITDLPLTVFFRTPLYFFASGSGFRFSIIPAMALVHSLKGPTGIALGGGIGSGYLFGARLISIEGILYWGRFTGFQTRLGLVFKL